MTNAVRRRPAGDAVDDRRGSGEGQIDRTTEGVLRGALPSRTVCMPLSHQLDAFAALGLVGPFGDDLLSIGHLKIYADGTLTGGTAAFSDELAISTQSASFFHQPDALVALIRRAWTDGWRVAVHAQGDRAISLVLDGFESGVRAAPRLDGRPRIEHAGFPTAREIERMRALDVIAVQQPTYLFDYGDQYAAALGDRAHELQPWRTELDAGIRVVISSDSDVASFRPSRRSFWEPKVIACFPPGYELSKPTPNPVPW